jgi:hypothetical protein
MLTLSLADQNVGVNGARSTAMAPGPNNTGIIRTLARNADCMYPVAVAVALAVAVADASVVDYPAIVTFELVGNDVCTPHPTFDRVRPPFPVVLCAATCNWNGGYACSSVCPCTRTCRSLGTLSSLR